MPEVPECLNRRYKALDELIGELNAMSHSSHAECVDPSIKLMCKFWNILKDDPCCHLTEEVQHCFPPSKETSYCSYISSHQKMGFVQPQRVTCYMANKELDTRDPETPSGPRKCAPAHQQSCSHQAQTPPLNKVLNNLKTAASHDNNCNVQLKELLAVEKNLRSQISRLEEKEKEGVKLMKEADKMWSGMEDAYKEKIAESLERQNDLMTQLQDIESSAAKWRKNKRDLEAQLDSINQCQLDMVAKINQKTNDLKAIDGEITAYKRRMEETKKECEAIKKSLPNKKEASNVRLAKIAQEISKLEKVLHEESKQKIEKEKEGKVYIAEAREELQKICKVAMQRKLEREDLEAEKIALIGEINLLKDTCDHCKERCSNKQKCLGEEIKKIDMEIANFKVKCLRCNQCVDTADARVLCTDCPRCIAQRQCMIGDSQCAKDPAEECVCLKTKKQFLDNVFENMATVLEKRVKTKGGKALGTEILECLKKSRNGKLNNYTRQILQEFVLNTVKKNLNLTIVGGAIKTRCEMDDATYKQLLLCIKGIKPTPPPKTDKGTDVKKDPCTRYGGECHCPKGPKNCVCKRKAPPAVDDPATCPPEPPPADPGEKDSCPHKKETIPCGPECGSYAPDRVGADVAKFKSDPCAGASCPFGKNMRAAQCVLGPEPLKVALPDQPIHVPVRIKTPSGRSSVSGLADFSFCDDQMKPPRKPPCVCQKDSEKILADECKSLKFQCKNSNFTGKPIQKVQTNNFKRPVNPFTVKFDNPLDTDTESFVHFLNEEKQIDIEYVNINTLPSGAVNIELNDSLYNKIQANIKSERDNFVYLRETGSGRHYININSAGEKPTAKLFVKQTASGVLAFDVVKDTLSNSVKGTPSTSLGSLASAQSKEFVRKEKGKIGVTKAKQRTSKYHTEEEQKAIRYIVEVKRKQNNTLTEIEETLSKEHNSHILSKEKGQKHSTWNTDIVKLVGETVYNDDMDFMNLQLSCDQESPVTQLEDELQIFYERNDKNLNIDVNAKNGTLANIDAFVTRTLSGHIALNVQGLYTIGTISSIETGSPVVLERSVSGSYKVYIGYSSNEESKNSNAILVRTKSNELLIVMSKIIPNSSSTVLKPNTDTNQVYKIKLQSASFDEKIPPVVLKPTPSLNYIIEMDKEFERKFTKSFNFCIDQNGECLVTLHKTDSHISVKFDEYKKNAILFKTPSNTLKVLVNGPLFENLAESLTKTTQSAKQLEDLLSKLPSIPITSQNKQKSNSNITFAKSISDPYLYNANNIKQTNILAEPSIKLQKTESGQYAAILDKESKKSFVNDLKTHLVNSPQGRIPIKKTESGQTLIMLNSDEVDVAQYGSLKITSSGNFYVMVDRNKLNELQEKERKNSGTLPLSGHLEIGSEHMIRKLKEPKHQSTATSLDVNSHGKYCKCLHDPKQKKMDEFEKSYSLKSVLSPKNIESQNETCLLDCCTSKNRNPYKTNYEDSCYYFSEILYNFEDKLESLSQEILEVTGLCQRVLNE